MRIEFISTGDEVLQGQILDTNAAWVAAQLFDNGLGLTRKVTLGDELAELSAAFQERSQVADVIIVNGGLGPTSDDLSAAAAAAALGEPLELFSAWLDEIERKYVARGRAMPDSNRKQAMLPRSARILDNPIGTACGFVIRLNKARLYFTPGVPSEFKRMFNEQILPELIDAKAEVVLCRLHTFGLSESGISDRIGRIDLPASVVVGYRSAMPTIEVKLRVQGQAAAETLAQAEQQVAGLLGDNLFCRGALSMAEVIQQRMLAEEQTLALAESCTGGMVASQLVAVAGSSGYLERGFVTYSNEAKTEMLGVPPGMIATHGAVSEEVVRAMAEGALAHSRADLALAVSGIAGPGGGTVDKPVGTVAFALASRQCCCSQLILLPDRGRSAIRTLSSMLLLDMLRRHLTGLPVLGDYEFCQRQGSHHTSR